MYKNAKRKKELGKGYPLSSFRMATRWVKRFDEVQSERGAIVV